MYLGKKLNKEHDFDLIFKIWWQKNVLVILFFVMYKPIGRSNCFMKLLSKIIPRKLYKQITGYTNQLYPEAVAYQLYCMVYLTGILLNFA